MADFHRHSDVIARKPHSCEQCGTTIPKGEKHLSCAGSYDGDFYDYRVHYECDAAANAYAKFLDLGFDEGPWFQEDENYSDDWEWMVKHHPLVAKRLGWDERLKEWHAQGALTQPASPEPSQEA